MTAHQSFLILQIQKYVSEKLKLVDSSHDMSHVNRVLKNAKQINEVEKGDSFLIEAGVLLHDIIDSKLFVKEKAEQQLNLFLGNIGLRKELISTLVGIIKSVSFGDEFDVFKELSLEQKIVRDADRLDAIGAIGIARTFHYGGSKNRELYNLNIQPKIYRSTEEYRKSMNPTINHFYEKLLLLKDKMETQVGKLIAQDRHEYMLGFLEQFYSEIGESEFPI